jgi:hypothetical protein
MCKESKVLSKRQSNTNEKRKKKEKKKEKTRNRALKIAKFLTVSQKNFPQLNGFFNDIKKLKILSD